MFSYSLPKFAALHVNLPTGGGAILVHVGEGRFLSKIPPIAFAGVSPVESDQTEGLPVTWDNSELAGDKPAFPTAFVFDAAGAQKAVEDAAAAGDTYAKALLDELAVVEKMMQARAALGVMDPIEAMRAEVAERSDPVDAAAADGVGSGA